MNQMQTIDFRRFLQLGFLDFDNIPFGVNVKQSPTFGQLVSVNFTGRHCQIKQVCHMAAANLFETAAFI